MNGSIWIRVYVDRYADLAVNGQIRNKAIQSRTEKRWTNQSGPLISLSDWNALPPVSAGGKWCKTSSIFIDRYRLATKHDLPSNPANVGFIALKRLGSYIPPHNYYKDVHYAHSKWWTAWNAVNLSAGLAQPIGSSVDRAAVISEARAQSVSRFWAKARDRQVANAALALVDLKSSIGMATSAVITITQVIMWLKRGRFDKAVDALIERGISIPSNARRRVRNYSQQSNVTLQKWSSDAWLELQFGWKPLIDDVYNTAQFATKQLSGEYFPALTLRGRSDVVIRGCESAVTNGSNSDYFLSNHMLRVEATIVARFRVGAGLNLANAFGLDNPLSILWDLVPFSFVVDWFLPIKRYLDNLSALNELELIHCHQSLKTVDTYSVKSVQTRNGGNSFEADNGRVLYERTRVATIPPETFEIPDPGKLIDSWKFGTAYSLLEQRKKR